MAEELTPTVGAGRAEGLAVGEAPAVPSGVAVPGVPFAEEIGVCTEAPPGPAAGIRGRVTSAPGSLAVAETSAEGVLAPLGALVAATLDDTGATGLVVDTAGRAAGRAVAPSLAGVGELAAEGAGLDPEVLAAGVWAVES